MAGLSTPASRRRPSPPPRQPGSPYRIALVCLGNICRSAMADVVLEQRLEVAGLAPYVHVASAGTGDWHVGNPMDRRAAALLTTHGYDASRHRAQQLAGEWLGDYDLVLAMDRDNLRDVLAFGDLLDDPDRLRLFRELDPRAQDGDLEVPDPYYGGDDGFATVLAMVERTCDGIVAALQHDLQED